MFKNILFKYSYTWLNSGIFLRPPWWDPKHQPAFRPLSQGRRNATRNATMAHTCNPWMTKFIDAPHFWERKMQWSCHCRMADRSHLWWLCWKTTLDKPPEKVGDESQPPKNCSVAKSTRRHTFGCFLCQMQNWISMSELHGYGLHMGVGWAAESLAPGHLEVPQAHRAMTVPLPEEESNSHALFKTHDCSIARSKIEQPCAHYLKHTVLTPHRKKMKKIQKSPNLTPHL